MVVQRLVRMSPALDRCSQVEKKCVNTAGTQVSLPSVVWQRLHESLVILKGLPFTRDGRPKLFCGLPSPMAWEFIWAKGSIGRGAAVAGVLIVPPHKHRSPWEVVCVCDTPALPSVLCLRLLAAPKAISHVLSNNMVLVTASQLDFNLPAKGYISI